MGLWRHVTAQDFDVNDFKAYYTAALAVRSGQAGTLLYSDPGLLNLGLLPPQPWVDFALRSGIPHPSAYIYPPFFAVLLAPLTLLPYHAANLAWFALNTLLLCCAIGLLVRCGWSLGTAHAPRFVAGAVVIFTSLNFFPTVRAMQCGQAGPLLLFLTAAALAALLSGRDRTAGLCLAVAAAVKLTPALLIVWLVWAGRRRAAAWGACGFAGLTLIAGWTAGWGNHLLYVTRFLPALSRGAATYANQSINGFLNRLLTDTSMTLFDFSTEPAAVRMLTRWGGVALLAAAFWISRPRASGPRRMVDQDGSRRLALGFSLVVLTSLIVSPISWEHHYVLALVPLSVMIFDLEAEAEGRARAAAWLLAIAYVAMAADAFELIRKDLQSLETGARLLMSYVLYGGLLLWGLTAAALARRESAA